jgi:DNA topoisomerase-1
VRCGSGFRYTDAAGRPVRSAAALRRIRALAIPPAWTRVWICPLERGHIQATGRDARGRKQYRYHPQWTSRRNGAKFRRLIEFGEALPRIRRRVCADLQRPGLPREKILAAAVRLLDRSPLRVGNRDYARENHTYGLTTLGSSHARVRGSRVQLRFRGKGGRPNAVDVADPQLARVVRRCRRLSGSDLFQYIDAGGGRRAICSADVNAYLREASGEDLTAKDFRTWRGTLLAALELERLEPPRTARAGRRAVARAVSRVARELGNTPAVCRTYYISPSVVEAYLKGQLREALRPRAGSRAGFEPADAASQPGALRGLSGAERALLDFLRASGGERRLGRAA